MLKLLKYNQTNSDLFDFSKLKPVQIQMMEVSPSRPFYPWTGKFIIITIHLKAKINF